MGVKYWLMAMLTILLLVPQDASAATGPRCSWMTEDQAAGGGACSGYTGITNKAVKCISITLMDAGATMIQQLTPIAWPIGQAVILLGFAFMGYRLMLGGLGQNAKAELFIFFIKGALVVYFVLNMEVWFGRAVCASGDFLSALTNVLKSQTSVQMMCIRGGDLDSYSVWNYMDCFISSILTMNPEDSPPQPSAMMLIPLGIVMFGMMVGAAFSGPLGTYLMMSGIAAIFTLLFSFFRCAYAFLTAIMALMVLFCVGLFVVPLIMLGKFGDSQSVPGAVFGSWLRAVISNMMQPIVVVSFITFSIIAIDYFFFSAPKSLMEAVFLKTPSSVTNADIEQFRHGFLQNTKINMGSMFVPDYLVPNSTSRADISTSQAAQTLRSPFMPQEINLPTVPALNIRQHPTLQVLAADCLTNDLCAKELQNAFMEGVLSAFITMIVLSALIFAIMEQLPNLSLRLIGDLGRAAPIDNMPFASQARGTDGTFIPNIYANVLSARDNALAGQQGQTLQTVQAGSADDLTRNITDLPNTMLRGSIWQGMFPKSGGN